MTTLREAAQQALESMENNQYAVANQAPHRDVMTFNAAITALRAALVEDAMQKFTDVSQEIEAALAEPVQEPVECEPQYANEDGWCDWVCPKPQGYLMQCCDCDLIHEVESRVAKYQPRPSEEFEVVDDPDLQVQWRMKRRDDISPKQPVQEPVAWEQFHEHMAGPSYRAPPQRKPLTEEEIESINRDLPLLHMKASKGSVAVVFARAIERAHGIGEQP